MSRRVKPENSAKKLKGFGAAVQQLDVLCYEKSDSWKKDLFVEFLCDIFEGEHHPGQVSQEKQNEIFSGDFSAKDMRKESGKIGHAQDATSFVRAVQRRANHVVSDPTAMRFLSAFAWWLQDKKYLLDGAADSKDSQFREAGLFRKCKLMLSSEAIPQRFDPAIKRPPIPDEARLDDVLSEVRLDMFRKQISKNILRDLEARLAALRDNRGNDGAPGGGDGGRGGGGGGFAVAVRGAVPAAAFDGVDFPVVPTTLPVAVPGAARPATGAAKREAVGIAVPVTTTRGGGDRAV